MFELWFYIKIIPSSLNWCSSMLSHPLCCQWPVLVMYLAEVLRELEVYLGKSQIIMKEEELPYYITTHHMHHISLNHFLLNQILSEGIALQYGCIISYCISSCFICMMYWQCIEMCIASMLMMGMHILRKRSFSIGHWVGTVSIYVWKETIIILC